jgi:hypothetical protein
MIIGIAGRAGAGKDEVAKILNKLYNAKTLRFSAPLKRMAEAALNFPIGFADTRTFKDNNITMMERNKDSPFYQMTGRGFLLGLGDAIRDSWNSRFVVDILDLTAGFYVHDITIPDVRYENELEYVKNSGGIIILVIRPGPEPEDEHRSEAFALECRERCDYIIDNSGTLEDLKIQVEREITLYE